jgi:alpha-amylase
MARFKLAIGIHNHQPVGNYDHVFRFAHKKAYGPFLSLIEQYESIRFSLHQSGILWQWQENTDPAYLRLAAKLVKRGQMQLLTGGFFEPILISIPERDAVGQVAALNDYLASHFNVTPRGLWLTERIWEPHLPGLLSSVGVRFVPLDDTHFLYAGLRPDQLTGPFTTEHGGDYLTVLPIQKRLRYLIPFGKVETVIDELKRQAERIPDGLAVYADDGEKFGVWPGTHKHCYTKKWLERFFTALEKNSDWLEVIPLSEAADYRTAGRVYLPSASYEEMLHWALPADAYIAYEDFENWLEAMGGKDEYARFVRGGHWRGFLSKYDEANLMHKKMLAISRQLNDLETDESVPKEVRMHIRENLYAGQCNCPYWHGIFGGLYLPHIRQAVYEHLIEAEAELRAARRESGVVFSETDYDADGAVDICVQTDAFSTVINPRFGGALWELSLLKHGFSLTDTLTRRREGYHRDLARAVADSDAGSDDETASIHDRVAAKEPGLEKQLVEDWYVKRCLVDHFFTGDVTPDVFRTGRYGEEGDFIVEPWRYSIDRRRNAVELTRDGHLWRPDQTIPVRVAKTITFEPKEPWVDIVYRLSTRRGAPVMVKFAVENSFNFQAGHASDRYVMIDGSRPDDSFLDSTGRHVPATSAALVDDSRDIAVAASADRPGEIWHLPIFTVSMSEGGFEKVYQGTTVLHVFALELTETPQVISFRLHAGDAAGVLGRLRAGQTVS